MPRRETPFFEDPDYEMKSLSDLAQVLRSAPDGILLGIKRPTDFTRPECPARIARDLPNARLIVVLRNPVQRAISACYHFMQTGFIEVGNADTYLRNVLDTPPNSDVFRILENGCYAAALKRYLACFPKNRLHLLLHDKVMEDPAAQIYDICDFLGIERDFDRVHNGRVVNRGLYAEGPVRVMSLINRAKFRYDRKIGRLYERPGIRGRALSMVLGASSFALSKIFNLDFIAGAPNVSQHTMQRLLNFYMPDIEELESLTGFDLTSWKRFDSR